jgi:hypothetical protein
MDLMYNERFGNNKKDENIVSSDYSIMEGILSFSITIWVILLWIIWLVGGISAFIASLVCMFYNSNVTDKIVGFLLAFVFGPLYWGFYIYKASYCNKFPQVNYYYE